ncbi:hypothetical protein MLD38_003723 [Melastoma candidum]|uniref:Uncharacterized protein n=1 Tax=Melastoma candidum TaxID=119954 RepID=A0ACB9S843_9MYRT|nr:hypothetical protein MLD38_003723 [Melastoma candidum]
MGCPNSDHTHVPDHAEEDVEDGVETLSLCDLALYGDGDAAGKCDEGRCSTSSEENCDQELFEFSSGELGSAPIQRAEKIVFCGRIIHFQDQQPPMLCVAKSPVKDCPRKETSTMATICRTNRRRLFRWRLRLFRKPRMSGYHKMKAGGDDDDPPGRKQKQRRKTYSRGVSGKWYFLMFGSARFPVEMGLQDIKSRQGRRTNPSKLFGLSDYAESEAGYSETTRSTTRSWGLTNLLRCLNRGNGHHDNSSHRNAVVKVSNGCFPRR